MRELRHVKNQLVTHVLPERVEGRMAIATQSLGERVWVSGSYISHY